MQLILRTLLRTFQAQIAKKIRTFGSGSASAQKNDVLTKKKRESVALHKEKEIISEVRVPIYMQYSDVIRNISLEVIAKDKQSLMIEV